MRSKPVNKRPRVRRLVLELDQLGSGLVEIEREIAILRQASSVHATSKQHQVIKRLLVTRDDVLIRIESESALCEEAERAYVMRLIGEQRVISDGLQRDLKQGVLDARRNQRVRQRLVKIELFDLDDNGERQSRQGDEGRGAEGALKKTEEVNRSLHRLRDNMLSNNDHATAALEALRKQTKSVDDTHAKYGEYGAALQSGEGLVSKLQQRQRTDAFLLVIGLIFFFLVCAFIVLKRVGGLVQFFSFFFALFSGASSNPAADTANDIIASGGGG